MVLHCPHRCHYFDALQVRLRQALTHPTHSSTAYGWQKIPGYYEQRDLLGMWYTGED